MDKDIITLLRRSTITKAGTIRRGAIVLLLCLLLGIMGSITYSVYGFTRHGLPTRRMITPVSQSPTKLPVSSPSPTSIPTTQPLMHTPGYPIYNGNTDLPEIALTFDDGPNPYYTPQILAILQQFGVKATFFDVGYLVQDYPAIVQQEFRAGHVVANHTWSHAQLTKLAATDISSQLKSASDAIQSVIGVRPLFFRPPYGAFNQTVIKQADALNLTTIIWNDEARDWTLPGVNIIISRILNLAHDGAIILLHDGGGFRFQTVAALPTIITILQERGFKFVTVQQLVNDITRPIQTPPATPPIDEGTPSPTSAERRNNPR